MKRNSKSKNIFVLLALFIVAGLFIYLFSYTLVFSAPDNVLNYQGKLTDTSDISVADASYDFKFTIWDAESGGNCQWSAQGSCVTPTAKSITLENGVFSTVLGEAGDNAISLNFNSNYWLQIQVESDSAMTPRKRITAAGFAINTSRLNGQLATYYLDTSATAQTKSGDLTITGDLTTSEILTSSGDLVLNPTGSYVNLSGSSLRFDYSGSLLDRIEPSSVGGYMDFYASNSGFQFNTTTGQDFLVTGVGDVGFGTSSPNAKLEILSTGDQLRLSYDASTYNTFQTDASGNLTITGSGNFTFSGAGVVSATEFSGDGDFGDLSATGTLDFPTNSLEISDIDWDAGEIVLHAEYPGAVLAADGSDNTGVMTSDSEGSGSNRQNYYEWYSSEVSLNDYDVRVRFTLPPDFDSWDTNAILIDYATETTASTDNQLDISVYLESSATSDVDDNDNVSGTAATWTNTTIASTSLTDCETAGETCEIILRLFSKDSNYVRVGDITLNYNRP